MTDTPTATDAPAELVAPTRHDDAGAPDAADPVPPSAPSADPAPSLDVIHRGLAPDADDASRARARTVCRELLAALGEPQPAPVLASPPVLATPPVPVPTTPIAAIVETLRKLSPDQLLDLAIRRLRAALPSDAPIPAPETRFQLVQIPLPGGVR
jgi:hypothetical protein